MITVLVNPMARFLQEKDGKMNKDLADLTFFLIGFFRNSQEVFGNRRELNTHVAFERRDFEKLMVVMDIPDEEALVALEEYVIDVLMSP